MRELIDQLATDAQQALAEYERARTAQSEHGMDLVAQKLTGLRIGLGRALACRDGLPAQDVVTAFNRGRDYQDQLRVQESGPQT